MPQNNTHPSTLLRKLSSFALLALLLLLTSCYQSGALTPDAWNLTDREKDSISFYTTHHYTQNFNFIVRVDSMHIVMQHPQEVCSGIMPDTLMVRRGDRIVVADIFTQPSDSVDSIWIRVARDQATMGWVHEREMLKKVSPDDPISQFIDFFSDTHLLIALAILVGVAAFFIFRRLMRLGARMVHFNDIPSVYPTLLCLAVAAAAVFYSTIQISNPESWRHYYYHPTLNPFSVPLHIGLFLASVWAIVILAVATIDDVRRHISGGSALFYYVALAGMCAVDYVVFSVSTLYYIGYPLLVAYVWFGFWQYYRHARMHYICGNCGTPLQQKGKCPKCGAINE